MPGSSGSAWTLPHRNVPQLPGRVGPYQVVGLLGEGGMGSVFLGEDDSGQQVALKVLAAEFLQDPDQLRRFQREGDTLARLNHPNIMKLIGRGLDSDTARPYLACEYVAGEDLFSALKRVPGASLPVNDVLRILEPCASGVAAAHAAGVLHRDLKLSNIVVTQDHVVKLIDFGISLESHVSVRLTSPTDVVGTLSYMAPEVVSQGWTSAADLYALGCVAFRLFVGYPPFHIKSMQDLVLNQDEPAPSLRVPGLPPEVGALVDQMLSKDPDQRPQAEAVVATLRAASGPDGELSSSMWSTGTPTPGGGVALGCWGAPPATRTRVGGNAGGGVPVGVAERYRLDKRLGRGAMGEVYRVEELESGAPFAMKVLNGRLVEDEQTLERFRREMTSLTALRGHPGIVQVHDVGWTNTGRPFYVMELVEGQNLRQLTRQGLNPETALDVIEQVAEALEHAHARGLVHRDVKPDNVMVDSQGRAKLGDFGLAKALSLNESRLTQTGDLLGTPAYMAPEQVSAACGQVGPWTDVFALGAMVYEVFAGKPPYADVSLARIYMRLVQGAAATPLQKAASGVSDEIAAVCAKAIAIDPQARFREAGEFVAALRHARGARAQRRGGEVAALVLGGVLLAICAATVGWLIRGPGAADRAQGGPPKVTDAVSQPRDPEQPAPSPIPDVEVPAPLPAKRPARLAWADLRPGVLVTVPLKQDTPGEAQSRLGWITATHENQQVELVVGGHAVGPFSIPRGGYRGDAMGVGARVLVRGGLHGPGTVKRRLGPVALVEYGDGDREWAPVVSLTVLGEGVGLGDGVEAKVMLAPWRKDNRLYTVVVVAEHPDKPALVRVCYLDWELAWVRRESLQPLPVAGERLRYEQPGGRNVDAIVVDYPGSWVVRVARTSDRSKRLVDLSSVSQRPD